MPYQTTPPVLQFYNATPGTTPKPLQAGELNCFALPTFWPDSFVPHSPSSSDTHLKWIRGLLFKQLPRFTMSTTLFQAYCLTLWNEVENSRIQFIRMSQRRKIASLHPDVPDAPIRPTDGKFAGSIHGRPRFLSRACRGCSLRCIFQDVGQCAFHHHDPTAEVSHCS